MSLDKFKWGLCVAASRRNRFKDGETYFRAIVPFLDFFKHQSNAQTEWNYNSEEQVVRVITKVDIPKGQEVKRRNPPTFSF